MMHTTSPFMTSKLTPRRTSSSPKDLCTSRIDTIGWLGSQLVPFILASRSELHRQSFTAKRRSREIVQRAIG